MIKYLVPRFDKTLVNIDPLEKKAEPKKVVKKKSLKKL